MSHDTREKALDALESGLHAMNELLFSESPAADEAQDFFLHHDLQALIDETRQWRQSHWQEESFRPDYCAAREALQEHLRSYSSAPQTHEPVRIIADLPFRLENYQLIWLENGVEEKRDATVAEAQMWDLLSSRFPAQQPPHPDDTAIDKFAAAMKQKMSQKREQGRGGWDNTTECSADNLRALLSLHLVKGDPVDVGNFAMMLFNRNECTTPTEGHSVRQDDVSVTPRSLISSLRS
jgi:hypothetical protein